MVPSCLAFAACSSSSSPPVAADAGTAADGGTPLGDAGTSPDDGGTLPSDSGASLGDGSASGCTYTITGASTGSGTCTVGATYDSGMGGIDFGVRSGSVFNFGATIAGAMTLTAGTYTLTEAPGAGAFYLPSAMSEWAMCNNGACTDGQTNPIPNQGTFTLTVTDPGPLQSGVLWGAPHGTVQITMPADPGTSASGTVMATATF